MAKKKRETDEAVDTGKVLTDEMLGEDDLGEELRKKAMEQHQSIVEEFGKAKADEIVDYAANCATLVALVRQNIPIEQKIVDEYNALCEDLYPEHCTPFAKKVIYMALHEMMEDGKKNFK